ncbi:MAG: MCE family protein [Phycisphaerales bacterium]|nr:MCE family protein [Phycisphaerales bacterium]
MQSRIRDLVTGFVSLVGMVGFAMLLMMFGEFQFLEGNRYTLTIALNDAGGLRAGSTVTLNGVPIGRLDTVELAPEDTAHPVRAVASIEASKAVPRPVQPQIVASLLGGSAVLQLQADPAAFASGQFYTPNESTPILGEYRTMIEELSAQLDERMASVLDSLASFRTFADTYTEVGRNLNDLLQPQTEQDVAAGQSPNLRLAVARFNGALEDAREAIRLANGWLGDEQLRADFGEAVRNANTLIVNATETMNRYTALADSLDVDAKALVDRVTPVADEMAQTLQEVRRVATMATSGKGTVTRLLQNPDLYDALTDAARRLDEAIKQVNLLLEKIKQEGLKVEF